MRERRVILALLIIILMPWDRAPLWAIPERGTAGASWTQGSSSRMLTIACPDIPVQDQQGQAWSFHHIAGNRLVLLSFTYGTCRTACPLMNGLFAAVHRQLGERAGRDVVLITVTVDPERDRPDHLAIQHQQVGSPSHWYRLTGDRTDLARLWQAFGIRAGGDPASHTSDLFIGSPARRSWRRVASLLSPHEVIQVLDETEQALVR
jgi:protein SCO1/2